LYDDHELKTRKAISGKVCSDTIHRAGQKYKCHHLKARFKPGN